MHLSFYRQSVGAKIAIATALALLFVTLLPFLIFFALDIELLSKFTFIHVVTSFVILLVFVEIVLVMIAANYFVGRPLQNITQVMRIAEDGNFLIRTEVERADELGAIGHSFNKIMAKITDLDARKIEMERELLFAKESLKYKSELEEKAKIIELTNQKLKESLKDLSILYTTLHGLSLGLERSELLHTVTRILPEALQCKEFTLMLLEETKKYLVVEASHGFPDHAKVLGMKFKIGEGVCGIAALEKKTLYIADTRDDPRYLRYKGEKHADGSFVSLPLIMSNEVVGVLNIGHATPYVYSETDIQMLESVAGQIALAYDRSKLYMKTKELSVRDELTGIYNRRHFHEMLQMEWKRSLRFNRPLALLMIDVDYFKQFNDVHGHLEGDEALKKISKILDENIREVDTLARFGGEEFVVLLANAHTKEAHLVGDKLRKWVEQTCILKKGPQKIHLTVSMGISVFPNGISSEEELINTADIALYRAKNRGRNQLCVYEDLIAQENEKKVGNLS